MPLTISLAPDIAKALCHLAMTECRSPKQHATWLLTQVIKQAAIEQQGVHKHVEIEREPASVAGSDSRC